MNVRTYAYMFVKEKRKKSFYHCDGKLKNQSIRIKVMTFYLFGNINKIFIIGQAKLIHTPYSRDIENSSCFIYD